MASITTRSGKGSALTNAEVDANFTNLNTDKAEKSITVSAGTGLTGGGDLSANRTFALATSGVTAAAYGGNNSIPSITVDAYGRVTLASAVTPSGTWGISISGNAATVTNGVYTTGSYADPSWITSINYSKLTGTVPTWNQNTTGSAATLTTGRTIGMTGDVTWTSASFNGSANVTGTATLANSGVTAATYGGNNSIPSLVVDAKGRVTSASVVTPSGTWGISITGSAASATGNAGTATALQTGRSINGTTFNGTADITTANWGTARTITIGSSAKSVNGSANVSFSHAEIDVLTAAQVEERAIAFAIALG